MSATPWFDLPAPPLRSGDRALVVGAGLAGAHCAYFLAARGIRVTVLEAAAAPATGASGNPAGVLLPFLSRGKDDSSYFLDQAYGFACYALDTLEPRRPPICGTVVHLLDPSRLRRFQLIMDKGPQPFVVALDALQTARIVGLGLAQPSLLLQGARALDPALLCRDRLDHPNIQLCTGHQVEHLVPERDGWSVHGQGRCLGRAPVVVVANGHAAQSFQQLQDLPLCANPGQLVLVDQELLLEVPAAVVCHHDYLIPGVAGQLLVGASWRDGSAGDLELSAGEQSLLLESARELLPQLGLPRNLPLRGRVAVRASSPDHLPLVGPMPDLERFSTFYGELHQGRRQTWPVAPYHAGLYVSLGHGARGLLTTPLASWLLAAMMVEGGFIDPRLVSAVHPGRFLIRQLRRHPRHRKSENL